MHRFQIPGTKLGMTQLYDGDKVVPVTVVEAAPVVITQIKTPEADGYAALQVGFGTQKEQRVNKPEMGHLKKNDLAAVRGLQEIRLMPGEEKNYKVGDKISLADGFKDGDILDVIGTSKGKGFQGVMKRHNFKGFLATHGTHEYFRHGGAIGCRLTPGRVFKGKKMPGQMGNKRTTVQNLKLFKIDADKNLLFIKGAVPGHKGGHVTVCASVKKGHGAKPS